MQFTLAQLRKLPMPYSFDESLDLSYELDGFEDILSSKPCNVHTTIKERGLDTYLCSFEISIDVLMQDAVTLEGIPYHIETKAEEVFSLDETLEDVFLIEGQTLDTKEAILTNIMISKPMVVTKSNEVFSEIEEVEEEDEYVNPAFASLKDLL